MAVTESNILTASGTEDTENNREYQVVYRVITNDVNDGPKIARAGTGLTRASTYAFGNESDSAAYFSKFSSARESGSEQKGRKVWLVTADFSTAAKRSCDDQTIDDPLQLPPKISGSFAQFQRPISKDRLGNDITNTAGAPITDCVADDSRPTLIIEKNFATANLAQWAEYRDSLNSTTFFGLGPRKWKLQKVDWEQVFQGSCSPYYPAKFEFHANFDSWDDEKVSMGFYALNGFNRELILDDLSKLPIQEPVPLDKFGAKLAPGAALHYIKIEKYKENNFGSLGVPTSL